MYILDLWVAIISCTSFWALWTFGFRPLILDRFRFEIEGLLIELDELAETGCLSVTSEVYQSQRATLEGLIKIAPKFGIMQLVLSHWHAEETMKGTPSDPTLIFEKSIVGLQSFAQDRLRMIQNRMGLFTLRFVLFRAPFIICLVYAVKFFSYISGKNKKGTDPVETLQREAYDFSNHSSDEHVLA